MWKALALLCFSVIVADVAYHLFDGGKWLRRVLGASSLPRAALRNGIGVPGRNF